MDKEDDTWLVCTSENFYGFILREKDVMVISGDFEEGTERVWFFRIRMRYGEKSYRVNNIERVKGLLPALKKLKEKENWV